MKLIVFDLDDTLFKERDFVDSAFRNISTYLSDKYGIESSIIYNAMKFNGGNPFDSLLETLSAAGLNIEEDIAWLVDRYRTHFPDISLNEETAAVLETIIKHGDSIAIITDGRINTQSNKIEALGLNRFLNPVNISISEAIGADKNSAFPFERIMSLNPDADSFTYVADNITKDFLWPNRLGWSTVMLLDPKGVNIHHQPTGELPHDYLPHHRITTISELLPLIYESM